MRESVKSSLQTSLHNGSLAEIVATLKADKKCKEIEAMRSSIKSIFQASLCDGRLSEVISNVKNEKLAAAAAQASVKAEAVHHVPETVSFESEAAVPKPAKPTSAKTTARPSRRSSLRVGATPEQPSPAGSATLPPRLPTPAHGLGSRSARGPSTLSLEYLSEAAEPCTPKGALCSSPRARLHKLSRPASPVGALPPVTPPCKQPVPSTNAMALDLATSSARPSAMMLDLEASRSLTSLYVPKTSSKQAPSFLPAIGGCKGAGGSAGGAAGKLSSHKRSSSMDSFVWGVAPVANKFVF